MIRLTTGFGKRCMKKSNTVAYYYWRINSSVDSRLFYYHRYYYNRSYYATTSTNTNDNNNTTMISTTDATAQEILERLQHTVITADNFWVHRKLMSQVITMLESRRVNDQIKSNELLTLLCNSNNNNNSQESSFRIGIAGSPGAGKSTFVEAFGKYLLEQQHHNHNIKKDNKDTSTKEDDDNNTDTNWNLDRLGILCIDPSASSDGGGSILGDKTRMIDLSMNKNVYIRPCSAQGILGGLAPRTDDVTRLLSSLYPIVIIETVGLGQSEIEIQQTVDLLILAIPPASGDDLQAVKKGIVEVADMIVITKADDDLLPVAKRTAADYRGAMQFLHTITDHNNNEHYQTPVLTTSSRTKKGFDKIYKYIYEFRQKQIQSGRIHKRRKKQNRYWLWKHLQEEIVQYTLRNNADALSESSKNSIWKQLDSGKLPPRAAAVQLLHNVINTNNKDEK